MLSEDDVRVLHWGEERRGASRLVHRGLYARADVCTEGNVVRRACEKLVACRISLKAVLRQRQSLVFSVTDPEAALLDARQVHKPCHRGSLDHSPVVINNTTHLRLMSTLPTAVSQVMILKVSLHSVSQYVSISDIGQLSS